MKYGQLVHPYFNAKIVYYSESMSFKKGQYAHGRTLLAGVPNATSVSSDHEHEAHQIAQSKGSFGFNFFVWQVVGVNLRQQVTPIAVHVSCNISTFFITNVIQGAVIQSAIFCYFWVRYCARRLGTYLHGWYAAYHGQDWLSDKVSLLDGWSASLSSIDKVLRLLASL